MIKVNVKVPGIPCLFNIYLFYKERGLRGRKASPAEDVISKVEKESLYITSSGINFPVALEGALKFKEASLTHAEGIQLGELLHGPIALTNKGYPIVVVKPSEARADNLYNKVIRSVLDKGSPVITESPEGDIKSVDTTSSKPNIKCYTTSIYGLQIRSKKEFADR